MTPWKPHSPARTAARVIPLTCSPTCTGEQHGVERELRLADAGMGVQSAVDPLHCSCNRQSASGRHRSGRCDRPARLNPIATQAEFTFPFQAVNDKSLAPALEFEPLTEQADKPLPFGRQADRKQALRGMVGVAAPALRPARCAHRVADQGIPACSAKRACIAVCTRLPRKAASANGPGMSSKPALSL